jgi:hypothetical protein
MTERKLNFKGDLMNKTVRFVLVGLLGLALVGGLAKSMMTKGQSAPQADSAPTAQGLQTVRLLTGSAKFGFLADPQLKELLAKQGLQVELTKSASFEKDVQRSNEFDAVWPAGANAAADFSKAWKAPSTYPVFTTPLAIASWTALVPVLQANGLAKKTGASHADFYLDKALPLMSEGKRWNQLKDNTVFSVNRGFLVNTPDVRKSTTGALYVAYLAYLLNNNEVPSDIPTGEALATKLSPLITRQGFQEGTLAGPFEDYFGQGMGKAPMVLVYESQYIDAKRDGKIRDTHTLLYPQPGLVLKQILVARTEPGKKLGDILANDPEAQKIAAKYGFRTNDPAVFAQAMKDLGLDAPELLNLADAPSTVVFDAMNNVLTQKLEGK